LCAGHFLHAAIGGHVADRRHRLIQQLVDRNGAAASVFPPTVASAVHASIVSPGQTSGVASQHSRRRMLDDLARELGR
jgi:hypothetical protein